MITRYIVMEFVEGGTLHDAIQISNEISEATIRHIIRQILAALEYMHDHHHVSHRDLKPAVQLTSSTRANSRTSFFVTGDYIQQSR